MKRLFSRIAASVIAFTNLAVGAQTLPFGFERDAVLAVSAPTALAFTPDGRLLVTTQAGRLLVKPQASTTAVTALNFNAASTGADPKICTNSERGLLGVAVDPLFASNQFIYLFYTARNGSSSCGTGSLYVDGAGNYVPADKPVNRVSRFTLGNDNIAVPSSELIIVNNMPSFAGNHNAGDVHFGKDGYLYVSIGDGGADYAGDSGGAGSNDAARDKHVLTGKILRVTRTGGVPSSNPFTGAGTGVCAVTGATTAGNHCQETFAWGLRNPFRFSMDSNVAATRFFINDVGQGEREEVDDGRPGADYGWYCREGTRVNSSTGKCNPLPVAMVDPIFEYPHGGAAVPGTALSGCNSITGGAFIPNGIWPGAYDNTYLLIDFVCGGIFSIPVSASPQSVVTSAATFASGVSSATTLAFGPSGNTQALYYTSYATGVSRIRFAATRDITFQSAPSGLRLSVNGVTRTTPFVVTAAEGANVTVLARDQNLATNGYGFSTWSDTLARSHVYTVPAANATLTATFNVGSFVPSLDIDNDGNFDALTDGVLLLRYLFGVRDAALVDSATGVNAERSATAISNYIATLGNAFDIDNNQSVTATTDGLLVLRYLLGLRGTALTQGALGSNALRSDATDIANYLQGLIP